MRELSRIRRPGLHDGPDSNGRARRATTAVAARVLDRHGDEALDDPKGLGKNRLKAQGLMITLKSLVTDGRLAARGPHHRFPLARTTSAVYTSNCGRIAEVQGDVCLARNPASVHALL
jgi:hypothetical protein